MSHYGHDMDHDGKITSKDHAMFHEMMAEDEQNNQYSHNSAGTGCLTMLLTVAVPLTFLVIIGSLFS